MSDSNCKIEDSCSPQNNEFLTILGDVVTVDKEITFKSELQEGPIKRKLQDEKQHQTSKKQKNKGTNKNRGPTFRVDRESQLCPSLVDRRLESDPSCSMQGCKFMHDLEKYLEQKLTSLGEECYVFNTRGHCRRGLTCRFGSNHFTKTGLNIVNESLHEKWLSNKSLHTINSIEHEIQVQLRKHTYNFDKANKVLCQFNKISQKLKESGTEREKDKSKIQKLDTHENSLCKKESDNFEVADLKNNDESDKSNFFTKDTNALTIMKDSTHNALGPVLYDNIVTHQSNVKSKIDWKDKLFLSPLTTVGNLPFRRICKEYGADVTCGEMALAVNLLQGKPQEWALTKRHGSEDIFGVQICGNNAHVMTKCAQLIQDQVDVDFIDINVGCPIDLIYKQGAGSGLLNKKKVLFSMVRCMTSVLDIPLTVKTRMGVYTGKNVAHTYMPELTNAGADLITIHGRTKEQRYTKLADWKYIEQCAQLASPTPVIGNGDILSYEDYESAKKLSPNCASVMIGRGALIKPWVFSEIKDHRHWDISSHERYQMLQRYTNYGLEHWGSDTKCIEVIAFKLGGRQFHPNESQKLTAKTEGVESTRRFMLEWLSFLYRYVPLGLMENPPQKMNERPPKFQGRDELEILMASPNSADWIKISEMLLGPVPDGFHFLPKHKANSWT